ncbi:hypothetical protein KJ966_05960 [bacterium]|nr:hypothetical protein [bacterium]
MADKKSQLDLESLKLSVTDIFSSKHDSSKKTIGIELELLPLKRSPGKLNGTVEITTDKGTGSFDLLKAETKSDDNLVDTTLPDGTLRLSTVDGGNFTFEPGGQIEYSTSNRDRLDCVLWEMLQNVNKLQQVLNKESIWFFFGSLNPWHTIEEIGLKMKKSRYQHMNNHFASLGPFGQQMMRLTTSIQMNLDLGDHETMKRRWLASQLLSPVLCAVFGNSPFINGQSTGFSSYRSFIWQNLDRTRTGFPHLRAAGDSLESPENHYFEFAMNASVIRLPDSIGDLRFIRSDIPFKKWLEEGVNGYFPEQKDWENHLSSLFPEVRPKGFLELRSIDSQAAAWWSVPAILITSILYDDQAMEKTISLLFPWFKNLNKVLFQASEKGMRAFPEICRKIFEIALKTGNPTSDQRLAEYMERFYVNYTRKSRNPADELLELNNGSVFTSEQYLDYEGKLSAIAEPPFEILSRNYLHNLATNYLNGEIAGNCLQSECQQEVIH